MSLPQLQLLCAAVCSTETEAAIGYEQQCAINDSTDQVRHLLPAGYVIQTFSDYLL